MQFSPSFDCNWANKTTPLHVGTSYTHDIRFYSKRNVSATHQIVWAGSLNPQIAWVVRGLRPLRTPLTHLPLKFSPCSIFRPKGSQKTIKCFSNFHGLIPDTSYKHLECFVRLGTHSQLRRGQMSHICDISPLRVNSNRNLIEVYNLYSYHEHVQNTNKSLRVATVYIISLT